MNAKQMQAALESAIVKHSNAEFPGAWKVNSGEGYIMLVWTCDEDESPEMKNGAEPWEQCGGDAILETADIGDFHDSGGDAYQDKFGENVITQWVQWNISDEDE